MNRFSLSISFFSGRSSWRLYRILAVILTVFSVKAEVHFENIKASTTAVEQVLVRHRNQILANDQGRHFQQLVLLENHGASLPDVHGEGEGPNQVVEVNNITVTLEQNSLLVNSSCIRSGLIELADI